MSYLKRDRSSDEYWVETLLPGWITTLELGKPLSSWAKGQLSVVLKKVKDRMEEDLETERKKQLIFQEDNH